MKAFAIISVLLLCSVAAAGQNASLSHNSYLRTGPSVKSKILVHLLAGTEVTIVSKYPRSGYVRVKTADESKTGWIWKRNIVEREQPQPNGIAEPSGGPTETSGARIGDPQVYPIATLTPGKDDPRVTQENIADIICNNKWSTISVRPKPSVTNKIKRQTMQAYGFTDALNHYELDHLISLQNGGCPDCVENLWPEAYGDRNHPMTQDQRAAWNKLHPNSTEVFPGALQKDLVESHIHDEICFGIPNAKMSSYSKKYPPSVSITLKRGQEILATDWYACYQKIMDGNKPCE